MLFFIQPLQIFFSASELKWHRAQLVGILVVTFDKILSKDNTLYFCEHKSFQNRIQVFFLVQISARNLQHFLRKMNSLCQKMMMWIENQF